MTPRREAARVELLIAVVLRAGVGLGALLIIVGLVQLVRAGGASLPSSQRLGALAREAWRGRAWAIVDLGLLVLIATPVCRVVLSIAYFALSRDWLYTTITLLVLGILVLGFYLGGI